LLTREEMMSLTQMTEKKWARLVLAQKNDRLTIYLYGSIERAKEIADVTHLGSNKTGSETAGRCSVG